MASLFEQPRNGTLFLGGQKISGSDIRDQNGMSSGVGCLMRFTNHHSFGHTSHRERRQELLRSQWLG